MAKVRSYSIDVHGELKVTDFNGPQQTDATGRYTFIIRKPAQRISVALDVYKEANHEIRVVPQLIDAANEQALSDLQALFRLFTEDFPELVHP